MAEKIVPQGYRFAGVSCGLKKVAALDLALIASDRPCAAAAVFTQNRFPAAPVLYDQGVARRARGRTTGRRRQCRHRECLHRRGRPGGRG